MYLGTIPHGLGTIPNGLGTTPAVHGPTTCHAFLPGQPPYPCPGEGDEGSPAALEDWRDFRARMVALEKMEAGETPSVPGPPSPNKDGPWAHILGCH